MKNEEEELKEWLLNFIKNKDLITKSIIEIEENSGGWAFTAKRKDGVKHYLAIPDITDIEQIISMAGSLDATVAVLNRKQNLDKVIENWGRLAAMPKLCIIFANPDSQTEKKWVLFPATHNRITEKRALKKGLLSMFETVDSC